MIIIKFVMLGCIIAICNWIGIIKANSFEKRYGELKKFKRALGVFKSKLEFTYEPIGEIFEDISKMIYENENNIFQRFIENEDWEKSVEEQKNWENEDKEIAKGLGKLLGKLDKEGQMNEICLVDQFIDKQIETAFAIKEKNMKLYKTLGRSIGIAIAIVLL